MRKLKFIAGIAAIALNLLGLEACKEAGKADEGSNDDQTMHADSQHDGHGQMQKEEMERKMPDRHKEFASPLINQYVHIKDALAGDNSVEASKAAREFNERLRAVDMNALPQEVQDKAGVILEQARVHGEQISGNGMAQQREQFEQLSRQMISLVALTGSHIPLYEQYCPMYNNNKGGVWLSSTEKILNPYFGSSMLSCGIVRGEYN